MGPLVLALVAALPAQDVEVSWRGDPRCPVAGFQDSLARHLAGATQSRPVSVSVDVRRDAAARWSATLVLATAEGRRTRTLRARSCAEIGDAAAFVTAVVVDPGVLARPTEGAIVPAPDMSSGPVDDDPKDMPVETAEAPAPADADTAAEAAPQDGDKDMSQEPDSAARAPVPDEAVAPDPLVDQRAPEERPEASPGPPATARPPGRLRGFVRVAGGLEALGLPRVGPAVGLAGGLLGGRWRVELTAIYRAPTTEFTTVDPEAGARVRMWAIGARGCGVLRAGPVEFPLCGGLEAGQAIGQGVGFSGGRTDRFAWLAAVLGPALAWAPRPWLALWLGADVGVPLLRGTFSAAGLGPMYEIAPVSLRAAVGLEFRFGRGSAG